MGGQDVVEGKGGLIDGVASVHGDHYSTADPGTVVLLLHLLLLLNLRAALFQNLDCLRLLLNLLIKVA